MSVLHLDHYSLGSVTKGDMMNWLTIESGFFSFLLQQHVAPHVNDLQYLAVFFPSQGTPSPSTLDCSQHNVWLLFQTQSKRDILPSTLSLIFLHFPFVFFRGKSISSPETPVFILVALARVSVSHWFNIMTRLASFYRK